VNAVPYPTSQSVCRIKQGDIRNFSSKKFKKVKGSKGFLTSAAKAEENKRRERKRRER
jgi:hypothetical protein